MAIKQFFNIPLTHTIIFCTLITLIAGYIFFYNLQSCMYAGLVIGTALFILGLYKNLYHLVIMLFICSGSIGIMVLRIKHIEQAIMLHQEFLQNPVIIKGIVQQVQHARQDKSISTILIKTHVIYDKEIGILSIPKIITLQAPYHKAHKILLGQQISVYNLQLSKPNKDSEYYRYLLKENIWATGYVTKQQLYISKTIDHWYYRYFNYLQTLFNNSTQDLYNPLFLGKKEKNQSSLYIQHQSAYWGIAHHMARSGIHLITLLGLFIAIFHYARIRSNWRFALYGCFAILYYAISIPSISFIRSLCMICFQMFSRVHGFQYSSMHALALTTLLIILYNPYLILFLDFQLSFGITAIIIWIFCIKWSKTIDFPLLALLPF